MRGVGGSTGGGGSGCDLHASAVHKDTEDGEPATDKLFTTGQEVWYDNGEDWVEAVIVKMGEMLSLEVRDTGERVNDVERDWISPMEYEDGAKEAEAEEEPEEEKEGTGVDQDLTRFHPSPPGRR